MITPKLQENGTYIAQVRLPDGSRKRIYGSTKSEVMEKYYRMANTPADDEDISLGDAMLRYVVASDSLSPNTIREYRRMMESRYDHLKNKKISQITSEDVRLMVSRWVRDGLSTKTIRNSYSFFVSSVKFFRPETTYRVSLPKNNKTIPKQHDKVPTDEDVKQLLVCAEGKACEVPIMLAAYCGMRLGEIAALHSEDLNGNVLHIQRSIAKDYQHNIIEKSPKTRAGDRRIVVPDFILEKLDISDIKSERGIASSFSRTLASSGIEPFKFHSLRHYYASWMHLAGYPDKYIIKLGGWEDVTTLQRIYQHALPNMADKIMIESAEIASKIYCDKV